MGILNVTPDSFSDQGRYFAQDAAVDRAWRIAEEGADILDIGGESTRPGSLGVTVEEELNRVLPTLETLALNGKYPIPISVDTSKAQVAKAALERGASIINDITSLRKSPEIAIEAVKCGAALVLMHMRGEPQNMQSLHPSADILSEIEIWAQEAVARARNAGIPPDNRFGRVSDSERPPSKRGDSGEPDRLTAAGFLSWWERHENHLSPISSTNPPTNWSWNRRHCCSLHHLRAAIVRCTRRHVRRLPASPTMVGTG
jgi:hypothetical protein